MIIFLINIHKPVLPGCVGFVFLAPTQHEKPKIANGQLSAKFEKMLKTEHSSH